MHFEWCISVRGYEERSAVILQCNHARGRWVPLPESWRAGLRNVGLVEKAEAAARKVQRRSDIRDVKCVVLGLPRPSPLPDAGVSGVPGAVAQLQTSAGMRQDYLLAAYVEEDRWLCHKGSVSEEGVLNQNEPFAAEGLVEMDILRDAYEPENAPRRRITGKHITGSDLRAAVDLQPDAWWRLVAVATWRAELLRSGGEAFDMAVASAGYEANPFHWKVAQGWVSHASVAFGWSWRQGRRWRHEMTHELAYDLTRPTRARAPPVPEHLNDSDENLLASLIKAADDSKVPCEYLGVGCGGRFEQSPNKWPVVEGSQERKSQRLVVFQYKNVTRGDSREPYRVRVFANNATHRDSLPLSPLGQSAPPDLHFDVTFMQEFADRKWPGTVYDGICFESDRQ